MGQAMRSAASVSLALLLCLVGSCVAQVDSDVCTETKGSELLPPVPPSFHATIMAVTRPNSFIGHASIMADVNSSRVGVTVEVSATSELRAIFDLTTGQALVINQRADQFDIDNCQVQNGSVVSFSTSPMAKVSFLGGEWIIPTGKFFSGAGLKVDKEGTENINEIPATKYRTCYYSSSLQTTLELTWWFSDATSAPVQVRGKYKKGSDLVDTIYVVSPLRTVPSRHDATRHPLAAPRGVYCKGLISAKRAPITYDRFSLVADQYYYNIPGVADEGPDSIRESYDQRGNLSMIEGEGLNFLVDKGKYGSGQLARISDFTRGISYVKNLRIGNCSYEQIPVSDWSTNPSPNGPRIKSPGDFYFPSVAELQYKGSGVFRSTDVDIYIGYKQDYLDTGDRKYPISAEYYLAIKVSYDGAGQPMYKSVPLAVYSSSPTKYYSLTEVFDFNTGVPRAYDHDISSCFSTIDKQHFELVLTTDNLDPGYVKYLGEYRDEFLYSLVSSLSKALNVSPLRIIDPMVNVFADNVLMLVEITVSDRAEVPGYTPKLPETTLSQFAGTMADLIAKNSLAVDVMEGDLVFQVPVKEFTSLDARGSVKPPPSGMSTGAIVGLSFGMILLGAVLGLGILFAVAHFRKDPLFGFKPFGGAQEA